jgi:hypothetical protein
VLLIAAMGERLNPKERGLFRQLTDRQSEPLKPVEELVAIVGRRGGKSKALATLAVWIAALNEHPSLTAGETGVVLLIGPDQRQASICLEYAAAALESSPILKQLVINRTSDSIALRNRIEICTRAASFRRLRGNTFICVLADEAAFWYTEEYSSNADVEILNAVRPGLATTRGPLIIASSPYARRGVVWNSFKRSYGPEGDPLILVAQGASRRFNPSLRQAVVDREYGRDPASAAAEYGGQFRSDIEAFVSIEIVEACLGDHLEIPPSQSLKYFAFCDPSGGSADSMTLAIAHRERDHVIIDAIRETKPPFSPESVVEGFSALLKSYRVLTVTGDRYAGEWPREQFKKRGVRYRVGDKTKSDLYRDCLPLLNAKLISLPKSQRLVDQLTGLERRVSRGGRDSIDHAPGGHDDVSNAVAGACDLIARTLRAVAPMQASWDNMIPRAIREQKRAELQAALNVAAGSSPCTLRFDPETPLPEGVRRVLGPPRLW